MNSYIKHKHENVKIKATVCTAHLKYSLLTVRRQIIFVKYIVAV